MSIYLKNHDSGNSAAPRMYRFPIMQNSLFFLFKVYYNILCRTLKRLKGAWSEMIISLIKLTELCCNRSNSWNPRFRKHRPASGDETLVSSFYGDGGCCRVENEV